MSSTFVDGVTPLDAVHMNALQQKVERAQPNGYASLDATGVVPAAQLPAPTSGVPTGAGFVWYTAAAPAGFLLCDGSAVSRTTYAALFALLGTIYGVGDGSTTFNLPDLRGRVAVGVGTQADVAALAANDGSTLPNRRPKHGHTNGLTLPNHAHSANDPGHTHEIPANGNAGSGPIVMQAIIAADTGGNFTASQTTGITVGNPTSNPAIAGTIGPAGAPADGPAYLTVNYIIKT